MAAIISVRECDVCRAMPGEYHKPECPRGRPFAFRSPTDKTEEWDMKLRTVEYEIKDNVPLRPVLQLFADAMEAKLKKNDHKSGWRNLPIEALFKLLMIEIEEFKVANEFFEADAARKELVDIANFCMMLHDRLGMEKDKNNGVAK